MVLAARNPLLLAHLDAARDTWTAFTRDESTRLLIWLAAEGELALLDAFVARECEPSEAHTPDLFVQLQAPFAGPQHGLALRSELTTHYDELARAGLEGPIWRPPPPRGARDDVDAFLQVLTSFRAHHLPAPSSAKLAIWLDPRAVQGRDDYVHWLRRALLQCDASLRFMITTPPGGPECALAWAFPERARAHTCNFAQALAPWS